MMSEPLSALSPAKQNSRSAPSHFELNQKDLPIPPGLRASDMATLTSILPSPTKSEFFDAFDPSTASILTAAHTQRSSPQKGRSPVKYRLQDETQFADSPPASPADSTIRHHGGIIQGTGQMRQLSPEQHNATLTPPPTAHDIADNIPSRDGALSDEAGDETDITLSVDRSINDETVGDLSSISAINTDMTRFANMRSFPARQQPTEAWSPSKQLRGSVILNTPGTTQRPLHLLTSRNSTSSNDDDDQTPRRPRTSNESPVDLMNFTGQSNIVIPPPSARSARRSPSGRGAFPIRVNPSPVHRSQASVDRTRSAGRSPEKTLQTQFPDRPVPATPASDNHRQSVYGAPTGFGMDLLDIDLGPLATPRSVPTVTPRELESLRSELQSRISGLEATLSGKEAEVMALKRSITDAEVRVGKTSEELRTERANREEMEQDKSELERRSREMEDVLREVKQNAFVEEREREKLRRQGEDAERRVEEHEVKILELNASLETLSSDRMKGTPSPMKSMDPTTPGQSIDVDAAVKQATETVARELHALYKTKHERKVADLKMSYERRWIKQVEQLRAELQASQEEVVKLQTEREATMSGVIPGQSEALAKMEGQLEEVRRRNEEVTGDKKVLEAEVAGYKGQMESVRQETDSLRKELETERVEKGELVAQVDLFLTMSAQQEQDKQALLQQQQQQEQQLQQQQQQYQQQQQQVHQPVSPPRSDSDGPSATSMASPARMRTSISGPPSATGPGRQRPLSMLQKPAGGKFSSGIPGPGSGLKAPVAKGAAFGGRSGGIMEGIARMGAGSR